MSSGGPRPLDTHQLAKRGLERALARIEQRPEDPERIVLSVCESLMWIGALDDWHAGAANGADYFEVRSASTPGRTTAGLVYARNLTSHGLASTITLFDVLIYWGEDVVTWGDDLLTWGPLEWRPLEDLPSPSVPERHRRNQMYADHVAGRPLAEPLHSALTFFRTLPISSG